MKDQIKPITPAEAKEYWDSLMLPEEVIKIVNECIRKAFKKDKAVVESLTIRLKLKGTAMEVHTGDHIALIAKTYRQQGWKVVETKSWAEITRFTFSMPKETYVKAVE